MNNLQALCIALVLALYAPLSVVAQDPTGNPENWCRNGGVPSEPYFKLGRITGPKNSKVHFFRDYDPDDCPKAGEKCREKSYVIPGDRVIVSRNYGDFICSWYQPRRGDETVGWLPLKNVSTFEPPANPALQQWAGTWGYGPQCLKISREGRSGFLKVDGQAYWYGLGDNVHEGSFAARARPEATELKLTDDDCHVTLRLIGDFLIAADNAECGGMNVRFNGVYTKRRR